MAKATAKTTILVVDDDAATCAALERALGLEGYDVLSRRSAEAALQQLETADVQILITDVVMEGMTGIGLLDRVQQLYPDLPVIVCTGYGTIESAVEAMQKGAADYLSKPINLDALSMTVARNLKTAAINAEVRTLRRQLIERHSLHGVIGRSPTMQAVFEQIQSIAPTDVTVLLRGESGTGKELIARAIWAESARAQRSLVTVDCAAIAESLIESELFGHERGAFTGATQQKMGKIEVADGGTLFLDEVGDLSPTAQTKLLRVIQERTLERVGGTRQLSVDVRVIAATNRTLERMIETSEFREDLYYRLNVVTVALPPLRERSEDVELLANCFFSDLAKTHNRKRPVLHRTARDLLLSYHWPGNVRELRNLCENLVVTAKNGTVTARDLPVQITDAAPAEAADPLLDGSHSLAEIERHAIFKALARTHGNKAEAARILGIGLKTLYRRLGEYDSDEGRNE